MTLGPQFVYLNKVGKTGKKTKRIESSNIDAHIDGLFFFLNEVAETIQS